MSFFSWTFFYIIRDLLEVKENCEIEIRFPFVKFSSIRTRDWRWDKRNETDNYENERKIDNIRESMGHARKENTSSVERRRRSAEKFIFDPFQSTHFRDRAVLRRDRRVYSPWFVGHRGEGFSKERLGFYRLLISRNETWLWLFSLREKKRTTKN